jgi:glycerophosphoryl diester phosphodiesterase
MVALPRIIAHRGSPRAAPENTLASFRAAAAEGARWVEFDAALTADARAVVFHDDALDRTTDGAGLLTDTSFEILQGLDAGSWFSRKFAGEMVPTLEEALELFAELDLCFNMEIKPAAGREIETANIALSVARQCWPAERPMPLVSSFSRIAVATAKEEQPGWPRSLLFDRLAEDWRAAASHLEVFSLGANQRHLTQDEARAIRDAGYRLTVYTVNDPGQAERLFAWGVDAIFTDVPGLMLAAFGKT